MNYPYIALHVAVARRSITAVKLLLDYKVKKNIQDSAKQTPLLLAVEHSLNDIIYSLLGKKERHATV